MAPVLGHRDRPAKDFTQPSSFCDPTVTNKLNKESRRAEKYAGAASKGDS
jgi:hypothetical protein